MVLYFKNDKWIKNKEQKINIKLFLGVEILL